MIYIIQPAIPKYRNSFFSQLINIYGDNVSFYSTREDFLGVKSDLSHLIRNVTLSDGFLGFMKSFYWHKDLPITQYKKNDIVVINGNPRIINYMLLFMVCKVKGIKTIWWGHGWSANSRGILSKIRINMMKFSSAILLYTDYEKKNIGVDHCYALNNGLDSLEIKSAIDIININRSYDQPTKSLVFIGRLTEKSDFHFLLNALSKTRCECKLNVIGSGEKLDEYKNLARKLNISHRISWFGQMFDEKEIAKIMLTSHAFIYTGAVGLSLIHAYNYGLPAIIHDCREKHMPEFAAFENGVNGISFTYGDVEDAASKIDMFFALSNNKLIEYSENAKFTVNNSYNTQDMIKRFMKIIDDLVTSK